MTTAQKEALSLLIPMKYQAKTISSSTGMARKNSTTSQEGQRTKRCSDILPTPRAKPTTAANRIASAAIFRVLSRPSTRSTWRYLGVRKTSHLS